MIEIVLTILVLAAYWLIFKKMGHEGWEGIIPFYNLYIMCEELYGNGWKFLFIFIPIFNIYFIIKFMIDLAHAFNKSTGFGIGLVFLTPIFTLILGLGEAVYLDGSRANNSDDFISRAANKATDTVSNFKEENAIEKLEKLNELKEQGIISEEEFEAKKAELLKRI